MSEILSKLIQNKLKAAFPEADSFYNNSEFADAIAGAIQEYLLKSVLTDPKKGPITGPGAGPVTHVHPQLPQGINAP